MNAAHALFPRVASSNAAAVNGGATARLPLFGQADRPGRAATVPEAQPSPSSAPAVGLSAGAAWQAGQARGRQSLAGSVVLALHLVMAGALWQGWAHHAVPQAKVLIPVHWMTEEESRPKPPAQPLPMARPELQAPAVTLIEPPLIAVAAEPAPSLFAAALPTPAAAAPAKEPAPAPVVQVVAPPAAPAIKRLSASAVRWMREPRMTVPLMSKRLRESGVVHVRVVVDVNGLPREVSLAKSSGFSRLDEQALQDIRTARFVPYAENGQPIEWEVIAPMSYEVDR